MIIKYLTNLGLIKKRVSNGTDEIYKPVADLSTAKAYFTYLTGLFEYQRDRQETIESKNAQLLGQASIVISIVALFIPLFSEKFEGINPIVKYCAVGLFLLSVFHYFLTILNAGKILDINKYPYSVGRTLTITKDDRNEKELDFINQQIDDLVFSINHNIKQNNKKGDCLIRAGYFFKVANIIFLILTIVLLFAISLKKSTVPEIKIVNANELCCKTIDSVAASTTHSCCMEVISKLGQQSIAIDSVNLRLSLILNRLDKTCVVKTPSKPRKKNPCP